MDQTASDQRTHRERMLAGDLYIFDDPDLEDAFRRAVELTDRFRREWTAGESQADATMRELIGHVGEDVVLRPPFAVDYGSNITIGARTFINFGLTALDVAAISIGEDCQIGPNVQLLTPTHPVEPQPRREKWEAAKPITIGSNVWLGGGVIVCPGVTIGDDAVIGAGSVVTRDIPAGVVAVGNPARVLRSV